MSWILLYPALQSKQDKDEIYITIHKLCGLVSDISLVYVLTQHIDLFSIYRRGWRT